MATKKRLTKQDKMLNTFLADLICSKMDYEDHKISADTLQYLFMRQRGFIVSHFDQKHQDEYYNFSLVQDLLTMVNTD